MFSVEKKPVWVGFVESMGWCFLEDGRFAPPTKRESLEETKWEIAVEMILVLKLGLN